MGHAFERDLLEDSNDDLASIHKAYATELLTKPSKAVHEAKEMIDDRLLAADKDDVFLLQKGPRTRLAGNLPVMAPKAGILRFPQSAAFGRAAGAEHTILGRGEFLAADLYAFVGRDLHEARRSRV